MKDFNFEMWALWFFIGVLVGLGHKIVIQIVDRRAKRRKGP